MSEPDPKSPVGGVLMSAPFVLLCLLGGCFGGMQLSIEAELRNGGRWSVPSGVMKDVFFPVAIYNKSSGEITTSSASKKNAAALFAKVAANNELTFLLPEQKGRYGTGKIHELTGRYLATDLGADKQRIELHWDENDDYFGVTTYTASNASVKQERYGKAGPGVMGAGIGLGLGLVLFFTTIGRHLHYRLKTVKPGAVASVAHYVMCVLIGGFGLFLIIGTVL